MNTHLSGSTTALSSCHAGPTTTTQLWVDRGTGSAPLTQLCREHDISERLLRQWREQCFGRRRGAFVREG